MDLRQIECFICLYREGSMTRAAGQLGIVQSALSNLVARLEKDLKVSLFDRSSRGVTPTVAGSDLYKMLLPLAADVENIRQRMQDLSGTSTGLVRLGVVPSLGISVVPNALREYCAQRPDVGIQLVEGYSAELIDRVEGGSLDFALVNHSQRLGGLSSEPVTSEELVLVASKAGGIANKGATVDLAELATVDLIVPSSGQGLRVIIDSSMQRQDTILRPRLEMDALSPTLELVRTGEWATILPTSAVLRELEAGSLRIKRFSKPIERDLIMVYHPRRPLSLAARKLHEVLERQIAQTIRQVVDALKTRVPATQRHK